MPGKQPNGAHKHSSNDNTADTGAQHESAANKSEFLKCLSEFFKRDLITIPVVKKYPHPVVQQRCGLRAATLELDTAAYPNIEYVAGTRLSVYPSNPASYVQAIMDHLIDDISSHKNSGVALPPNSNWWAKFVQLHKGDSLRLALTHLFDITIAPSREVIKVVIDHCAQQPSQRELKKRFASICNSNEAWEKWICSGFRSLKGLFDELDASSVNRHDNKHHEQTHQHKSELLLPASKLLAELELQTPRQYSISNIKSSKRFRTEIIVFEHKFNLRQIELNLRQLKERENFDKSVSSPKSPSLRSNSTSGKSSSPIQSVSAHGPRSASRRAGPTSAASPASRAASSSSHHQATTTTTSATASATRNVAETSRRSGASMRSIRSLAPFATSPPISTHQVKRVSSFSGPLMSMYATASTSQAPGGAGGGGPENSISGSLNQTAANRQHEQQMRSRMSQVAAPETNFSDPAHGPSASPGAIAKTSTATSAAAAAAAGQPQSSQGRLYEGLCSNYLINLNTNDQIVCEFVENPRFTLKGNRERPIMMIGQDVGLVAFRPFWQQRNLEHDRAQVFYTLFKDLSPKKFGEMQLVCITGHKCKIEELLFKREINLALTSKVLSSVTYIHRKHLVNILKAAHTKSQLVFAQYNSSSAAMSGVSTIQQNRSSVVAGLAQNGQGANSNLNANSLQITNKELLELGDNMYKLLVERTGCLYTCCDPHMTQAIEILLFECIARNNQQLTRERIMQLLPKWKGKDTSQTSNGNRHSRSQKHKQVDANSSIFTLENTYERARIVQEIYDNSI